MNSIPQEHVPFREMLSSTSGVITHVPVTDGMRETGVITRVPVTDDMRKTGGDHSCTGH